MKKKTNTRPRIAVYRSNKFIYAQVIDDDIAKTLSSVSEKELPKGDAKKTKQNKANELGIIMARKLVKLKIKKVLFDRNGYKFHGRVKSFAEGVKEGGIII